MTLGGKALIFSLIGAAEDGYRFLLSYFNVDCGNVDMYSAVLNA